MTQQFWGYSSQEEAEKHWGKLSMGDIVKKSIVVSTRGKKCIGRRSDLTFFYKDGTEDIGVEEKQHIVIIGENKIMW